MSDRRDPTKYKSSKPILRLSHRKKVEKDYERTKDVMDYYINASYFYDEDYRRTDANRDLYELYDAYNNRLNEEYFDHITNPFNSEDSEFLNFPSRLRPWSIIRPNVDLLSGEFERRPFNYTVKVNNEDAVNEIQQQQKEQIKNNITRLFVNAVNEVDPEMTGMDSERIDDLQSLIRKIQSSNLKDLRGEEAERALNVIFDELYLDEEFKRCFKDWLIAGETYSYKGIDNGDIQYERVSPLDIDYDKSPDVEYVEDGQWAVRRIYLTVSDILDRFYDELKEKEIDIIEESEGYLTFRANYSNSYFRDGYRDEDDLRRSKVEVFHTVWKYRTKVGIYRFVDEFGQAQEVEVDEFFKPEEGTVDWFWVNEVWEGYRISSSAIYLGIRPVPNQRNKINNLSSCKLPYNGKRFSDIHSRNISLVELGMPYEILYRIIHYKLELTIAKSKGKILLMDQNAIPNKKGWTPERFFYFAESMGFGLLDRNQKGVDKMYQYQVYDMGLYEHIANLIQIMEYLKQEWDELSGISRQRKGQTQASERVSGIQTAINQSSVISESLFSRFERFQQRELAGLLDCSKLAWLDGKKKIYYNDDLRTEILNIEPSRFANSEFDVHISRSASDLENLQMAKGVAQAMMQNGVDPSAVIDVIRSKSLSRISNLLSETQVKQEERAAELAQNEQEAAERIEQIKREYEVFKSQLERENINTEYDRQEVLQQQKYDREERLSVLEKAGEDVNENLIPDHLEALKVQGDLNKQIREQSNKDRELKLKDKEIETDAKIKREELKSKEKIEKLKAETSLKNPVPGEN